MTELAQRVRKRFAAAVDDRRATVEQTWKECARYAAPWCWQSITGNFGATPPPIWDETALVAADELAARLVVGLFPSGARWLRYDPPPGTPPNTSLRALLDRIAEAVVMAVADAGGHAALHLALRDVVVFGAGVVRVAAGPSLVHPVVVDHVPIGDVWIGRASGDRIGSIHVRHRMTTADCVRRWEIAAKIWRDADPDRIVDVVETWMEHPDDPGRWLRAWHLLPSSPRPAPGTAHEELFELDDQRAGTPPYVVARWAAAPGSPWGIGPLELALPAVRVLNEVVRLVLSHADLALSGMWMAEDDGVVDPATIKLQPGVIIPVAPGSQGLRPLQPPDSRFSLASLVVEDYRNAVRKALHADTVVNRTADTPPTALEVQARLRELARQIGPSLDRLWNELAKPVVERVVARLVAVGKIEREIASNLRYLDLVPQSSLVHAARADDFRRAGDLAAVVAQLYGPQILAMWMPAERFVRFGAASLDLPPDLVASREEVQRAAAQTTEAVAETAQAIDADQQTTLTAANDILGRILVGR